MANSVFVMGTRQDSLRFMVALDLLIRLPVAEEKVAYFKPLISAVHLKQERQERAILDFFAPHTATTRCHVQLIAANHQEFMDSVVARFEQLSKDADWVIIQGSDYYLPGEPFEADLNIEIAQHAGAPVLLVASDACHVKEVSGRLTEKGIPLAAVLADKNIVNILRKEMDTVMIIPIPLNLAPKLTDNEQVQYSLLALEAAISGNVLKRRLEASQAPGPTGSQFLYRLRERAKDCKAHIVLPEAEDPRILKAIARLNSGQRSDIILLGKAERIRLIVRQQQIDLDLQMVTIIDPTDYPEMDGLAHCLVKLRKHKGLTLREAYALLTDPSYFATILVQTGKADALVSGAVYTTRQTVKPALELIKGKPGKTLVSSIFFMCLPSRIFLFGDCAINPDPTAEQLAEIAMSCAATSRQFGIEPRVAMISYSSGTSGLGDAVDKVRQATAIVKQIDPRLKIEGPIQYDAAVNETIAKAKMTDSEVAGRATILIFPDLNCGNAIYKAVQQATGAIAIGPILQELNKPVNDLSRGATVDDIFYCMLVTLVQCQNNSKTVLRGRSNLSVRPNTL